MSHPGVGGLGALLSSRMLLSTEARSAFSGNLLQTLPYWEIKANSFFTSTKAGAEPAFLPVWLLLSMVRPAPSFSPLP